MEQSVEIICDSIGPNGKRVTTMVVNHWRAIHAELLRHRLFSFSVASSRAIPYAVQRKQVEEDPMMPILWPKQHKGMQGTEVFPNAEHGDDRVCAEDCSVYWLEARDDALRNSEQLSRMFNKETKEFEGLSKQLCNRLLEPWVSTRAVITATEWGNFFDLRHPWETFEMDSCHPNVLGGTGKAWGTKIDLEFPAEYNIQDLAIKMKKALGESDPQELSESGWHLPFIEEGEKPRLGDAKHWSNERWDEEQIKLVKLSAARCARTSYNKERGKTVEDDIKLADMLMSDHHWSPFEHQAQAIGSNYGSPYIKWDEIQDWAKNDGIEVRIDCENACLWSRNFQGWIQARAILDV